MADGNQQRVMLTYFRKLMQKQQERFRLFLDLLEKQKIAIEQDSFDAVTVYVELEERVFAEIQTLQRSIDTWEALYRRAPVPNDGTGELRTSLESLLKTARRKIGENQQLLNQRLSRMSADIQGLKKNPLRKPGAVYTGKVDLTV